MKKILILTYYWPPSGGAGVQRWLKFVKYLRQYGFEPVIYTTENPEYPEYDETLYKDIPPDITILRTHIWEPYDIYKKFTGQKKHVKINAGFLSENKKKSFLENISVWIRGNFFIPDARKFWIKPSVKYLKKYLEMHPVDTIVSTGPPHSMHLIAMQLAKSLSLPWLADFRDPWTNIDFYKDLKLTSFADKKHKNLEKQVLKNANVVTVISPTMAEEMYTIFPRKYDVITNGFDYEDCILPAETKPDKKFSIAHIGTMVKTRNPHTLWKVLSSLIMENQDFANDLEIKLVGKADFSVLDAINENGLRKYLSKIDYMPHDEVIRVQQQSQVLLLVINNTPNAVSILTGKFFEYLAARRPIICIGPSNGDAAKILNETKAGYALDYENYDGLKAIIEQYYQLYKRGNLKTNNIGYERFSRKMLTQKLAGILQSIS